MRVRFQNKIKTMESKKRDNDTHRRPDPMEDPTKQFHRVACTSPVQTSTSKPDVPRCTLLREKPSKPPERYGANLV